jgi:hypothetical protein
VREKGNQGKTIKRKDQLKIFEKGGGPEAPQELGLLEAIWPPFLVAFLASPVRRCFVPLRFCGLCFFVLLSFLLSIDAFCSLFSPLPFYATHFSHPVQREIGMLPPDPPPWISFGATVFLWMIL